MTKEDFIHLVRDELDLPLSVDDLSSDFDHVVSWDSMHMLRLVAAVERETGSRVPVGRLLADRSLAAIYERVSAA
ncbi:phosphopantetheine-binding protein [Streptomyces sp. SBC-4]|uniref:phosphopantetheine-binding protein n=1 Tax=Streptomyces sp. NBC_01255 TaxID=2903798 RepID=UPI002946108A|nr:MULTISPECIES: phosphopantetheine-binding protein [unclassified Streptomyces]MDV5145196.1 phosphopantetheine-binding protein [Streptomyces sp. SBC-4]